MSISVERISAVPAKLFKISNRPMVSAIWTACIFNASVMLEIDAVAFCILPALVSAALPSSCILASPASMTAKSNALSASIPAAFKASIRSLTSVIDRPSASSLSMESLAIVRVRVCISQPNCPTRLERRTTSSPLPARPSEMMSDADATIWALDIIPCVASDMSPLSAPAVVPMLAARFSNRLLASSSAAPSCRTSHAPCTARWMPTKASDAAPIAAPTFNAVEDSPSSFVPNLAMFWLP